MACLVSPTTKALPCCERESRSGETGFSTEQERCPEFVDKKMRYGLPHAEVDIGNYLAVEIFGKVPVDVLDEYLALPSFRNFDSPAELLIHLQVRREARTHIKRMYTCDQIRDFQPLLCYLSIESSAVLSAFSPYLPAESLPFPIRSANLPSLTAERIPL